MKAIYSRPRNVKGHQVVLRIDRKSGNLNFWVYTNEDSLYYYYSQLTRAERLNLEHWIATRDQTPAILKDDIYKEFRLSHWAHIMQHTIEANLHDKRFGNKYIPEVVHILGTMYTVLNEKLNEFNKTDK